MKKLVSYCGERVPVIDGETGVPTGEFTQPGGALIVEGWFDLTAEEIAELEAMQQNPEPEPVPEQISASQFFRALWKAGEITFEECRAALKSGDLPTAMSAMVNQLPEEQQQDALLIIEGATSFRRSHWLVPVFASLYGMTAEETDNLWRVAAGL